MDAGLFSPDMPRSSGNIQAEIDQLESYLATGSTGNVGGLAVQMSSGNTSLTFAKRQEIEQRLEFLYRQRDRLTYGIAYRGRVIGLAGGPSSTSSP